MTKTFKNLALVTSCLVFAACSGESHHEASLKPSTQLEAPKPTSEPATLDKTALTAIAPARPLSVLDGQDKTPTPVVAQVEPAIDVDFGHDEPELPSNYDRPLSAAEVKIERFVLATGVEQREPIGASDCFDQDEKQIFAFVELSNETEPYAVEVHFEKLGGPKSLYGVKLNVNKAARFRTWAWTKIRREPGEYRAVLRTPEGEEIASHDFVITERAHD